MCGLGRRGLGSPPLPIPSPISAPSLAGGGSGINAGPSGLAGAGPEVPQVQLNAGGGRCAEDSEMSLLQEVAEMIQYVTFLFLLSQGSTGTRTDPGLGVLRAPVSTQLALKFQRFSFC